MSSLHITRHKRSQTSKYNSLYIVISKSSFQLNVFMQQQRSSDKNISSLQVVQGETSGRPTNFAHLFCLKRQSFPRLSPVIRNINFPNNVKRGYTKYFIPTFVTQEGIRSVFRNKPTTAVIFPPLRSGFALQCRVKWLSLDCM